MVVDHDGLVGVEGVVDGPRVPVLLVAPRHPVSIHPRFTTKLLLSNGLLALKPLSVFGGDLGPGMKCESLRFWMWGLGMSGKGLEVKD